MEALSDRSALNQKGGETSGSQSRPSVCGLTAEEALGRAPSCPTLAAAHAYKGSVALRICPDPRFATSDARSQARPTAKRRMRQRSCPARAGPRARPGPAAMGRGVAGGNSCGRGLRAGRGSAPLTPRPPRCPPVAAPRAAARHVRAPQPRGARFLPGSQQSCFAPLSSLLQREAAPLGSKTLSLR